MNFLPFSAQRMGLAALALALSITGAHAQDTIELPRADAGVILETSATGELAFAGEIVIDMATGTTTSEGRDETGSRTLERSHPSRDFYNTVDAPVGSLAACDSDSDTIFGDRVQLTELGVLEELEFAVAVLPGDPVLEGAAFQFRVYDAVDWPTYPAGAPTTYPSTPSATIDVPLFTFPGGVIAPGTWKRFILTNFQSTEGPFVLPSQTLLITQRMVTALASGPVRFAVPFAGDPTVGGSDEGVFLDSSCGSAGMYLIDPVSKNLMLRLFGKPLLFIDINRDGILDCTDLAMMRDAIASGNNDPIFDIDGDGTVNASDVTAWIIEAGAENLGSGYPLGDADLNGAVDQTDYLIVIDSMYGTPPDSATWCDGDFNSDGIVNQFDLNEVCFSAPDACRLRGATPDLIYGVARSGNPPIPNRLVTINQTTGVAASIGTSLADGKGVNALAISPFGDAVAIAGTSPESLQQLYQVDLEGGYFVPIGAPMPTQNLQALAFDSDGVLYGIGDGDNALFTIDPLTGAILTTTNVFRAITGMAIHPITGVMYVVESYAGLPSGILYTLDRNTGTTTLVGSLGIPGQVGDIHFDPTGTLWGTIGGAASDNAYVQISTFNGGAAYIGQTGYADVAALATYFPTPRLSYGLQPPIVTLPLGGTGNATLSLTNSGSSGAPALTWSIVDQLPGGGDCPWLTPSITSGVSSLGSSSFVSLSIDSFGLAPGNYNAQIVIDSNDLVAPVQTVSVTLQVTGPIAPATVGDVFATQSHAGTGAFVRIDPATGLGTIVGDTRVAGMTGLAIDSQGRVFGAGSATPTDTATLYRIDTATGAVVTIGDTGLACFEGMAFDANDQLWAMGFCGGPSLYFVDTTTGVATGFRAVGVSMDDLSFDPTTGLLYGLESSAFGFMMWWTISTTTGVPETSRSLGYAEQAAFSFDADGDILFVKGQDSTPNSFWRIDNGIAVQVGPTGVGSLTALDVFDAAVVAAPEADTPLATGHALYAATPNPFNPKTTVSWNLPKAQRARLEIFDVRGRLVARLFDEVRSQGVGSVQWNGTNDAGQRVPSGVYLYRLATDDFEVTKRMVLLK